MLKTQQGGHAPRVTMVHEADLRVQMTTSGIRASGQPCQLTLAVNGKDPVSFLEDAGDAAPLSVFVDLGIEREWGRVLLNAFRTKPWQYPDAPIIVCPDRGGVRHQGFSDIEYLVRNQPIDELITLIRDTLDISPQIN
ncbi:MAG: hypothetical protein AAF439_13750 [Pseudomonadota bacterium]